MKSKTEVTIQAVDVPLDAGIICTLFEEIANDYGIEFQINKAIPAITISEDYETRFLSQFKAALRRRIPRHS